MFLEVLECRVLLLLLTCRLEHIDQVNTYRQHYQCVPCIQLNGGDSDIGMLLENTGSNKPHRPLDCGKREWTSPKD